MGLHRPGLKTGLTRRRSAALQDRWDREDAERKIKKLETERADMKVRKRAKAVRARNTEKTERIKQLEAELTTANAKNKRLRIAINIAKTLICSDDDFGSDNQIRAIKILEQAIGGD